MRTASFLCLSAFAWQLTAAEPAEHFATKVRPLLEKNCWACHTQSALGGLRLDSAEAVRKGGKSGPAVVPHKPAESLLMQAVTHKHERLKMPPSGKLSDADIAVLTEWIEQGAFWPADSQAPAPKTAAEYRITPEHRAFWSFQPVRPPSPPAVRNTAWAKGSIDRFILAALEAKGIESSPAADKRTLIRRATFDLIGLPPAPADVDAFLRDSSPDAFAKVIDRLLASPQYGERWGRHWLDIARYSDDSLSPTLSAARYPNSFRYRNWVIDAFNKDMPYDVFVKAQIAGDRLPSSDPTEFTPGLGFYALSPEMQDDRVDATTRGFLGLTVACAQCHDHKFDPIPTKDYYSLQGVFASTQMNELPLAPKDTVEAWQARDKKIKQQQETIDEFYRSQRNTLAMALASRTARYLLAAQGIDKKDGLDEETLERWRRYLGQARKEHPFLDKWSGLVEKNAAPGELRAAATEFQEMVVKVFEEKREVDRKNAATTGRNPEDLGNPTTALESLPRDKYMVWRDVFEKALEDSSGYFKSPDGVLYYGPGKIDRFLHGPFKDYVDDQRALLARLKAELPAKYPFLQTIQDRARPADVRVQIRGDRGNLGDTAPRRFLAILSPEDRKPFTKGSGRLELAEAIADPANPLTARVIVNRVWGRHFGRGIVATASNFGQMGERPSHPELLDYLADSLVKNKWSIKALHREIMLSATYQLSATPTASATAKDGANVYLSHASRQRLDVEALRDSILSVAGLLDPAPGDSARPLDASNRKRTVYGMVSRRKLDGLLAMFDFPNPNATSEGRIVTNVPLQRLFFLNSPFVEAAAQAFASRFEGNAESRIRHMYATAFNRQPDAGEMRDGLAFTAANGWAGYARVLLGLNEFYYVD